LDPVAKAHVDVEIAFGVDTKIMRAVESSREIACGPPVSKQFSAGGVLENPLRAQIEHPDGLILRDHDVRRTGQRPLVEILAVLVEDLNAVVARVGDIYPSVRIDRDTVDDTAELAGPFALGAPRHEELAVLVQLDHAPVL